MGLKEALITVFLRKFATLKGRATRSEYWWTYLIFFLITCAFGYLVSQDEAVDPNWFFSLFIAWLVLMIPYFAVTVRRLHDTDQTGLTIMLFGLAGPVGLLLPNGLLGVLMFLIPRGTQGPNRFGTDPLQANDETVN
jgi:uncharacterized membrane protein YhaH (DUF805 family)